MKNVQQITNAKPQGIFSVKADATVLDALKVMTDKNISSLLVIENSKLLGIFTERDYARKIILQGKSSKETLITEAMTPNPITVSLTDSIDHCMQIMTERHIRHLPVINDNQVTGMVSIGDVVKFIIEDQKQTISQLESYINS